MEPKDVIRTILDQDIELIYSDNDLTKWIGVKETKRVAKNAISITTIKDEKFTVIVRRWREGDDKFTNEKEKS